MTDAIERMEHEPVRQLISTPPQHAKTETTLHGLVWLLDRNPELKIAYVSYAQSFSDKQATNIRRYAAAAGLEVDKSSDARRFWRTKAGGYVVATSVQGELTGLPCDIIVIDDPYKDRNSANSTVIRDKVVDFFNSAAMTRLSPNGSVLVIHTRWHQEDLIATLGNERDENNEPVWSYLPFPAINEEGEALWPEKKSLKTLEKARNTVGEYVWSALYMCEPRVKGAELFGTPARYEHPNIRDCRIIIAADTAASEKTSADYSAAVVLAVHGFEDAQRADVLEVIRIQKEIPEVCDALEKLQKKYNAAIYVEAKGVGKAVPQFLRMVNPRLDIREITGEVAKGDKFGRAQPVSAAWNQGRVRLPTDQVWVTDFLKEVQAFTGVGDKHDDQVDALAYAWNVAASAVSPGVSMAPWHDDEIDQAQVDFDAYMVKREETLYSSASQTQAQHLESTKHRRYGYERFDWYEGLTETLYVCLDCLNDLRNTVTVIAAPEAVKHESAAKGLEYLNRVMH